MARRDVARQPNHAVEELPCRGLRQVGFDGKCTPTAVLALPLVFADVPFVPQTASPTLVRLVTTAILLALMAGIATNLSFCGQR